jgi:hypothetical protein
MTNKITKLALIGALLVSGLSAAAFANASAAFAEGANVETIYNPNVPGLSATDEMSQRIFDYGRREQLRLEQPGNRFDNGSLDDGQKGSN